MPSTLPLIFFGHGSPMNALAHNRYTQGWARIGESVLWQGPAPRAILCVSAHWYIAGTAVSAEAHPRTIHDFGGFPPELYAVRYPAPGSPELAERVRQLLAPLPVRAATDWGLDHGTWSVLCHAFPQAEIPVVQLSVDATKLPEYHYALGRQLSALREEGVLLVASGNIVHNLRLLDWAAVATGEPVAPADWAQRWDARMAELLLAGDHQALLDYRTHGRDAELSIPTPDHWLPLLYILGAARPGEPVSFPVEGIDAGTISMRSVQIG